MGVPSFDSLRAV